MKFCLTLIPSLSLPAPPPLFPPVPSQFQLDRWPGAQKIPMQSGQSRGRKKFGAVTRRLTAPTSFPRKDSLLPPNGSLCIPRASQCHTSTLKAKHCLHCCGQRALHCNPTRGLKDLFFARQSSIEPVGNKLTLNKHSICK